MICCMCSTQLIMVSAGACEAAPAGDAIHRIPVLPHALPALFCCTYRGFE